MVLNDVLNVRPAQLPALNSLSNLARSTQFTSVGYGAQSVTIDKGPKLHYEDTRYVATGGPLHLGLTASFLACYCSRLRLSAEG